MEANKDFDYNKAFHTIDDWSYGFIDRRNLKSFLRKHGHLGSNEEIMAIIRRLDLDADARLSKQEFIEGITPEEPYSKMMKRNQSIHGRSNSKKRSVSYKTTRKNSAHSSYYNYQDMMKLSND